MDALGNPLRWVLTAGQIADISQALTLIEKFKPQLVVADKGYDSDQFVQDIIAQGAQPVIPPRSNRKNPRDFDRHWYKDRNLVERFFNRIKQFRRIATRYEKLDRNFLSMLTLVCAYIWLL